MKEVFWDGTVALASIGEKDELLDEALSLLRKLSEEQLKRVMEEIL